MNKVNFQENFKNFIAFLKRNDAYIKFLRNYAESHEISNITDLKRLILKKYEKEYEYFNETWFISCAFTWRFTKEGNAYWSKLNEKWIQTLEEKNL